MEISTVLPIEMQQRAYNKLRMIHNALIINDLRIPLSNSLEKLKRDRSGQYSIRINEQWVFVLTGMMAMLTILK